MQISVGLVYLFTTLFFPEFEFFFSFLPTCVCSFSDRFVEGALQRAGIHPHSKVTPKYSGLSSKTPRCIIPIAALCPLIIPFYSSEAPRQKIRVWRQEGEALPLVAAFPENLAVWSPEFVPVQKNPCGNRCDSEQRNHLQALAIRRTLGNLHSLHFKGKRGCGCKAPPATTTTFHARDARVRAPGVAIEIWGCSCRDVVCWRGGFAVRPLFWAAHPGGSAEWMCWKLWQHRGLPEDALLGAEALKARIS